MAEFEGCDKCTNQFKPASNADRIRSMKDEELADFLGTYFTCEMGCPMIDQTIDCYDDCPGTILKWLQKTAE